MQTAFTGIDAAIVIGYLAAMAAVGVYFSRRQTTLDEFFVARRSMAWLPVGLSLMAALNSGIDYLMQPSATIRFGIVLLAGTSSWIFLYPWVSRVTLPFYRRMNLYSAYEFLEARFDVRVRTLAAGIFVAWRLGWMATALYVPCLAIDAATGSRFDLRLMILGLGVLVTLLHDARRHPGGDLERRDSVLHHVRWTRRHRVDCADQRAGRPLRDLGGRAGCRQDVAAGVGLGGHGSPGLRAIIFMQPITLPALVITMVLGRMASYTSDQVMVQRFQTTRSMADSRRAYLVNAAGDVLWMFGLSFVGLALLAYFTHHPLPPEYATDKILPYFMSQAFPAGAVGLVIAAILAASLSSIDSAINSCTTVVVVDFYNRFRGGRAETQVRVSRIATLRARPRRHGSRDERVAHRHAARNREQADQRVQRSVVRHLSARDVQPRRDQRGGARRRPRRLVRQLLRRLSHGDQLPVAVGVRARGDDRDRIGDRRLQPCDRSRAVSSRRASDLVRGDAVTIDRRTFLKLAAGGAVASAAVGGAAVYRSPRAREIYVRLTRPGVGPRIVDAPGTEVLYNGISLPSPWPPYRRQLERELEFPPYLQKPPAVIPIDVGRQLFVDDFLIEESNLDRSFHSATYIEGNPILAPATEWDKRDIGSGAGRPPRPTAMPFSDGVWFDPADRKFKIWYTAGYGRATCYAESHDGLAWVRPPLDVIPGTNIVLDEIRDSSTVWLDRDEPNPHLRYKMVLFLQNIRHLRQFVSPDGIHWTPAGLAGPSGDRTTLFYNPFRKKWVYSLRDHQGSRELPRPPPPLRRVREFLLADAVEQRRGDRMDRRGPSRSAAGRHRIPTRAVQPGLRRVRERPARVVLDVLR